MTKDQYNQLLETGLTTPESRLPFLKPSPALPTKAKIKAMIHSGDWETLGQIFQFVPVFMLLPGGSMVIDWRCVPEPMNEILYHGKPSRPNLVIGPNKVVRMPTHREMLYARQNGICHYCQQQTEFKQWSIDHVVPLCRGGKNHALNKVGACKTCNGQKGPLTEVEFRATEYLNHIPHQHTGWEVAVRCLKRAVQKAEEDVRNHHKSKVKPA